MVLKIAHIDWIRTQVVWGSLVTILPTVTQIPNAHLLAVNLMKKLSVIVILLDICGRCYKKFVWRKSRFPQIKRLKIFVLMSEPALNC